MVGQLPDFIGIGASKSATSWIAKCLDEHPAICMYDGKETRFFSHDDKYAQGIEYYKNCFAHCSEDAVVGEYTVGYLSVNREIPARIAAFCPHAKLIVSLRNPVEKVHSSVLHGIAKGWQYSLDDTIAALQSDKNVRERYQYSANLQRFFEYFPAERIHVMLYDDIQENPEAEIRRLYSFLNVDDTYVPNVIRERYNSTEARMSPYFKSINRAYLKVRKLPLGHRIIKLGKWMGASSFTVERVLRWTTGRHTESSMSEKQRRQLQELFRDDIQQLEALIGRDLSHWYGAGQGSNENKR
jgi:hypothetical protein